MKRFAFSVGITLIAGTACATLLNRSRKRALRDHRSSGIWQMTSLSALIAGLVLAGLPATGLSAGPDFAGTTWQLVSIQSMDDAQGTTRVDDPSRLTLKFSFSITLLLGA